MKANDDAKINRAAARQRVQEGKREKGYLRVLGALQTTRKPMKLEVESGAKL